MESTMKAPASALWIRLLGYGGATLLVAAAAVVLVLQWRGGTSTASAGSTTSASPSRVPGITLAPSGAATPSKGGSQQPAQGSSQPVQTSRPTTDPLTTTSRCKPSFASYQRSGDTVKVSVTKPTTGLVAAYIQIKGQDTPLTQSFAADGTKGKHAFTFTSVPAPQVQKISVGVISTVTLQNCDLT
jgi:hypothetical protein